MGSWVGGCVGGGVPIYINVQDESFVLAAAVAAGRTVLGEGALASSSLQCGAGATQRGAAAGLRRG